ncbi:DEAD/DEAH box helicase [Marispirochaeta aestuarii]|uniref:DEAD/DEAH box helicase n=1 Tax=Marispirochaeta aestuarii TaxID=1963862 RepID=UPI0029C7A54F|nr:DEAD/DEAH box helicase [Marispirochaeta aestuarii]
MEEAILRTLKADTDFMEQVVRWETIPAREGRYVDFPSDIDPRLREVLSRRGITRLYSHQGRTYDQVRRGRNVVVITPTASGKTLSYNLPVLQGLLENTDSRGLYLFPTKALSQDQQSALNEIVLAGEVGIKISTYDGDTPSSVRVSARDEGRIIISNPDMLHSGVLPNHPKWIRFFSSLRFVVIDEVHTYRGVFGSHMTNVIRRLKRIARFYGSDPVFICCSATIGNPGELAERILEEETVLIDENGAPAGEKQLILYNPPYVDKVQGIRRGTVNESQRLALKFIRGGVKTIVFARSRLRVELIADYINKALANHYLQGEIPRVEAYRGGYLPSERREIEKGLRDGSIMGVVSTNALELGIDIGGLDASIMAGFPGSIASSWQQAGRAGRSAALSVALMIASSGPIDQYIMAHPEYFLSRPPESAHLDPDNLYILMDHMKCAVFELPFSDGDGFGGPVDDLLTELQSEGVVRHTDGKWYWADRSYPSEEISLRSATADNIVIVDTTRGAHRVIGEMDRPSAKELIFDNAIYMHRGNQYVVKNLDIENRRCYVEASRVNYYTDAVVKTDIKILQEDSRQEREGAVLILGDILVRSQVAKFKKLRFHSHENVGYGEIHLPEEQMHTRGAIITFSPDTPAGLAFSDIPREAQEQVIARIGTLMKNVAPVFLLCDRNDLGVAERLKDPHLMVPSLFLFDRYPGGTGLAEALGQHLSGILDAAEEVVRRCGCQEGCPSCIGPVESDEAELPEHMNRKTIIRDFLTAWRSSG